MFLNLIGCVADLEGVLNSNYIKRVCFEDTSV